MQVVCRSTPEILLGWAERSVSEIPALCCRFLALTDAPEQSRAWRHPRRQARRVLQQCEIPGYGATQDAEWDLDWILDVLTDAMPDGDDLCLDLDFLGVAA